MFLFCSNKPMDNRINEIRRKISLLRARMAELEALVRDQIAKDLDCSAAAGEQLAARIEIARLIGEWKAAGGGNRLPDPASHKRVSKRAEVRLGLRVLSARA
jgi:chorismate mutase